MLDKNTKWRRRSAEPSILKEAAPAEGFICALPTGAPD